MKKIRLLLTVFVFVLSAAIDRADKRLDELTEEEAQQLIDAGRLAHSKALKKSNGFMAGFGLGWAVWEFEKRP